MLYTGIVIDRDDIADDDILQGDLEKQRDGAVFLTIHDVGCTVLNWHNFVMHPAMEDIRKRQARNI